MKRSTLVLAIIIFLVFITLLSFLHSYSTHTSYISTLDKVLLSIIESLWNLISQPAVAGIITLFIILRFGLPQRFDPLKYFSELTASVGNVSLSGKVDPTKLIQFSDSSEASSVIDPPLSNAEEIITKFPSRETEFLTDVANKTLSMDKMIAIARNAFLPEWEKGEKAEDKIFLYGISLGILRALNKILLKYEMEKDDDGYYNHSITIEEPILTLLFNHRRDLAIKDSSQKNKTGN